MLYGTVWYCCNNSIKCRSSEEIEMNLSPWICCIYNHVSQSLTLILFRNPHAATFSNNHDEEYVGIRLNMNFFFCLLLVYMFYNVYQVEIRGGFQERF